MRPDAASRTSVVLLQFRLSAVPVVRVQGAPVGVAPHMAELFATFRHTGDAKVFGTVPCGGRASVWKQRDPCIAYGTDGFKHAKVCSPSTRQCTITPHTHTHPKCVELEVQVPKPRGHGGGQGASKGVVR